MEKEKVFEHDGKKYKIKGKPNANIGEPDIFVSIKEPVEQEWSRVRKVEDGKILFDKNFLEDGDITGIKTTNRIIQYIEQLRQEIQKEISDEQDKTVYTYRTWTGKKRTKAESIEEAAEYFSEKYDVDATPENVEKVEEKEKEEFHILESTAIGQIKGFGDPVEGTKAGNRIAGGKITKEDKTPIHPIGGDY